jgi:hypothetical protein
MTGIKDNVYKSFTLWMINRVVAVGGIFAESLNPEIAVPIQLTAAVTDFVVEGWNSLPTDISTPEGTYQEKLSKVTNDAWDMTFHKFERLDLSKKCKEEMKDAFILWDKSKCIELFREGKKPLKAVESGIFVALQGWGLIMSDGWVLMRIFLLWRQCLCGLPAKDADK